MVQPLWQFLLSTGEAEARGCQIQGQPGLHRKMLFQKVPPPKKLSIPYDSSISLLCIYHQIMKIYIHIKTWKQIIIAALFIIAQGGKDTNVHQPASVVYLHKEILFGHKKEWDTDTYYKMVPC
jgi:hypothetical protein